MTQLAVIGANQRHCLEPKSSDTDRYAIDTLKTNEKGCKAMTTITIWHNPRCSKSRQALALLEAAGVTPKVVKYLETPPTESELKTTLKKLQCTPMQLVRRGEAVFKTLGLSKDHSDQEWITAMVSNPILIERPVIISQDGAVIGRPPENVHLLLD